MSTRVGLQNDFDYIVVGGGCMAVSTALALQREWPNARITIFEGLETVTASKGICRIIRTPYLDNEYVCLAYEAKKKWESELPYSNFYRRTGWVQAVRGDDYVPFHQGERLINGEALSCLIRSRDPPRLGKEERLWLNEDIGLVDASLALEAVAMEAAARGVERQKRDISRLIIAGGVCLGVECVDGLRFTAGTTILATGPWTPALLENSNVQFRDGFFNVTAIGVATLLLNEDEYAKFGSMPILATEQGEVMTTASQRLLQITSTDSIPITRPDELKTLITTGRARTNRSLLEKMIPEMKDRALDFSMYPELMTPYQHPLVDEIPGVRGLHIAAGGSYHFFKFLPVFGRIVVDYLRGIRQGVSKRWSWDRTKENVSIHSEVLPKDSNLSARCIQSG